MKELGLDPDFVKLMERAEREGIMERMKNEEPRKIVSYSEKL